jgi:hypothetical protein
MLSRRPAGAQPHFPVLRDLAQAQAVRPRALAVMSRQVVAWNPRDWGFAFESEVGAVVVVVLQEGFEGIAALV